MAFRYFILGINGFCRTFWFAECAVNTFVWVDNEEVRSFVKTVYGANFYAIRVFAFNAIFTNDKGHVVKSLEIAVNLGAAL